jgi:hypothetical protein
VKWLVLAGVVLTFLTAVLGFVQAARNGRKLTDIRVLVDGNLAKVMAKLGIEVTRSEQLTSTLEDAGVDVPDRPGHGEAGERLTPP